MIALIRCLVVCTLGDTIASFSPINALSKVLFPALGLPKILTNPVFIEKIQADDFNLTAVRQSLRIEEVINLGS